MKNKILTQTLSTFRIVLISSLTIFTLYTVQAWVSPTLSAPNGNVGGPLTTATSTQVKTGSLGLLDSLSIGKNLIINGNVGIGTTTPTSLLHVRGGNVVLTNFENTDTAVNAYAEMALTAGSATSYLWTANQNSTAWAGPNSFNIYAGSGGAMSFYTNATEKVRISTSGNVGIGMVAPAQKLSVAGTIESTSGGIKFPDATVQTTAAVAGGIGVGQTWQNVTGSRAIGTTYTNSTSKPIQVVVNVSLNAYVYAGPFNSYFYINGALVETKNHSSSGTNVVTYFTFNYIIPPGSTYMVSGGTYVSWFELR